jgi:peptide/nickel transport system substrate-binding protein
VEQNIVMRTFLLRMQNQRPPFDNINVRKAFAHAFNYEGFIKDILAGYAQRDPTPLPNTLWGFPKDAKGYDYDMKLAKDYITKAIAEGAPVKRPIELHVQSENDQSVQAAQMFQSDLADIGINLKVVPDTWANMTANVVHPETCPDMWVHWVSAYFVDPENWVGQMYDSQFHGTWKASSYYKNDKVDALLRQARSTTGQADRAPLYEEATKQIMADCADIWIYNSMQLQGLNNRVKGRRFCTVGQGCEMRWISI